MSPLIVQHKVYIMLFKDMHLAKALYKKHSKNISACNLTYKP